MQHSDLVLRADKWLKSIGCGVTFRELVTHTPNGENPDNIGWRSGVSILIECKSSRSDFLSDKRKLFRKNIDKGMGDWKFYLCPPNIIRVSDIPEGWGLLWCCTNSIKRVLGVPKGNSNWSNAPMVGNKQCENAMLLSALRRLQIRGHLEQIYSPLTRKKVIRKKLYILD